MSRIIKFRVWDKFLKSFKDTNENWCNDAIEIFMPPRACLRESLENLQEDYDRYVVQQFTGLFDSKGVEIYEGDIVNGSRNYWINDEDFQDFAEILEVKFGPLEYCKAPAFRFVMKDGCDLDFYGGPPSQDQMVIIGNIFENLELLK